MRIQYWWCNKNQKPLTRPMTHCYEHLPAKLCRQKGILMYCLVLKHSIKYECQKYTVYRSSILSCPYRGRGAYLLKLLVNIGATLAYKPQDEKRFALLWNPHNFQKHLEKTSGALLGVKWFWRGFSLLALESCARELMLVNAWISGLGPLV